MHQNWCIGNSESNPGNLRVNKGFGGELHCEMFQPCEYGRAFT
jgi:hypothetical protein